MTPEVTHCQIRVARVFLQKFVNVGERKLGLRVVALRF